MSRNSREGGTVFLHVAGATSSGCNAVLQSSRGRCLHSSSELLLRLICKNNPVIILNFRWTRWTGRLPV